ncbi:MAG: TlpA disulfide reductase family protein [Spirosomataceae bacterium]
MKRFSTRQGFLVGLMSLLLGAATLAQPKADTTKVEVGTDLFPKSAAQADIDKLNALMQEPVHQAFWQGFQDKFKADFTPKEIYQQARNMGVDDFEMKLYENRKNQTAFYKQHPDWAKFSSAFKQFVENSIRWNYWHSLLAYPIVRGNQQTKHLVVTSLPSLMVEDLDENKVNDENALLCEPYRHFLMYFVTYFNSRSHNFQKYSDMGKASDEKFAYAREHLTGKVLQYWLARYLVEACAVTPPAKVRELYGFLSQLTGAENYAATVKQSLCGEVMERKEEVKKEEKKKDKDKEDPNALYLTDAKGKRFTLSDFKGKVVYIDVWASWCGPCRQQFPFSKQMHEKLTEEQRKKIVFLYISIDDTQEAWKKAMEQLQLPGEHGWSEGGWNSKVTQYFGIQAIPRYILIGKDGKMVDANAKRPSDEFVLSQLLKLADK